MGHGAGVLPALFRSPRSPRVSQRRGKLLFLQRGDELSAFLTRSRCYQRGSGGKAKLEGGGRVAARYTGARRTKEVPYADWGKSSLAVGRRRASALCGGGGDSVLVT